MRRVGAEDGADLVVPIGLGVARIAQWALESVAEQLHGQSDARQRLHQDRAGDGVLGIDVHVERGQHVHAP